MKCIKPPKYSEKIPILHEKPNFYREHEKNEVSEPLITFTFLNIQGIIIIKPTTDHSPYFGETLTELYCYFGVVLVEHRHFILQLILKIKKGETSANSYIKV